MSTESKCIAGLVARFLSQHASDDAELSSCSVYDRGTNLGVFRFVMTRDNDAGDSCVIIL